jgi:mannan endo-1,4-beta-mannosidase
MRRALGWSIAAVLILAGCGQPGFPEHSRSEKLDSADREPRGLLGVFERGAPYSYRPVITFARSVGWQPNVVLYYSGWEFPFQARFAEAAYRNGAVPLIQIEPKNVNLAAIARGVYDRYLQLFAEAVRDYGHPVILSFTHEMNGGWYSWGLGHTSPATWISAWRHVVGIFRQEQARNVIWLWTVSSSGTAAIADWWPGAAYVNWVGVDGYYVAPTDSFDSVFGRTIATVRRITPNPILLSEVGVSRAAGQADKIPGLFGGIRRDRLLGVVWFDVSQHGSSQAQDWRLEGNPEALAAFRKYVGQMVP